MTQTLLHWPITRENESTVGQIDMQYTEIGTWKLNRGNAHFTRPCKCQRRIFAEEDAAHEFAGFIFSHHSPWYQRTQSQWYGPYPRWPLSGLAKTGKAREKDGGRSNQRLWSPSHQRRTLKRNLWLNQNSDMTRELLNEGNLRGRLWNRRTPQKRL